MRNLELVEPLFSGENQQTTLCYALDACRTPMGKRLLRQVILRPSIDPVEIAARHDAVAQAKRFPPGTRDGCAARWKACWIWSVCWRAWRSIPRAHAK